jgi:hypothetical protein
MHIGGTTQSSTTLPGGSTVPGAFSVSGALTTAGFTSTGIDDNATSTAITIDANENLGIGTASPLSKLDVSGGFVTVSKDANTAGRIGASEYITGSTANDLIVQATGSGVTKLYQSGVNSLNIDAAGRVTKPLQPAFRVSNAGAADYTTIGYMTFGAATLNTGTHYSTSTGKFTAPIAGIYYFAFRALTRAVTQTNMWVGINVNGTALTQTYHTHTNHSNISAESIVSLSANDYVQVYLGGGGIHSGSGHDKYTFFQGYLLG